MSSSIVRGRTALTVFAAAAMLLLGLAHGSAYAAQPTGSAAITISSVKAGKVTAIAPAKGKRVGKGIKATAPVKSVVVSPAAKVGLGGGIKLKNGKRKVSITGLNLTVGKNLVVVRGKLGKKNLVVFTARGKTAVNKAAKTIKVTGAKLAFPASVAKQVKKQLKLKKAPTGKIGTLALNAKISEPVDPCVANPNAEGCNPVDPCEANPNAEGCQPALTDPYMAECNVTATSKVTGSLAPASALPTLASPQNITGPAAINWGFKSSFRNYLVSPATKGSVHALGGATLTGSGPAYSGADFPVSSGQYSNNGTPSLSDDQAVINTTGKLVLCATGHKFRVTIIDPTFVIDGDNSRIIASVDTNLTGVWTEPQRIDLADLDLGQITQEADGSGSSVDFGSLSGVLTSVGADAICGTGEQAACDYNGTTPVDPVSVKINIASGLPVDTYNSQCGVAVDKVVSGSWPEAAPAPTLENALPTTAPTTIDWGYKSSFRGYVFGAPPAGTIQALDGASRAPGMDPTRGFSFPVSAGQYAANDPADSSDDQAVINGTGTGLFCKAGHFFWSSISNPTVIIDGDDSRLVADISQNVNGGSGDPWQTVQRVKLADLDLSGITPVYNKSGSEVTWSNIPVTLSTDAGPFATYPAGTALDPITVAVKTAYDTGAGDAAAWDALATYVQTNLPFPNSDATAGGCEVGVPAGGSAGNARTIDEHAALGGTTASWSANPNPATAAPAVTGTQVTGGNFNWGFRSSLRASLNATGQFNLSGGATASDPYVGNGPGSIASGGQMSGAGKYFTWPTTTGTYNANGAGSSDDQLVMRTQGTVAFCQTQSAQRYGIIFSNPTVIIDGANSRITIDATARYRLSWVRATVDFATLDLTDPGVSFNQTTNGGTTTVAWNFPDAVSNVGPVKLTADGEKIAKMLSSAYVSGLGLDGTTIRATFPAGS